MKARKGLRVGQRKNQIWQVPRKESLRHDIVFLGNKSGAIVFIDELDAIGTKRFGGEQSGDREVQRTMLELLSQLDGFSSDEKIKVAQRQKQNLGKITR